MQKKRKKKETSHDSSKESDYSTSHDAQSVIDLTPVTCDENLTSGDLFSFSNTSSVTGLFVVNCHPRIPPILVTTLLPNQGKSIPLDVSNDELKTKLLSIKIEPIFIRPFYKNGERIPIHMVSV